MKIAVATPCHGNTKALFTSALANMLIWTAWDWRRLSEDEPPEMQFFLHSSSTIATNRQRLVERAREWGADWILWLDADQTFPRTTLLRLLFLKQPVVGANYPTRGEQMRPTAAVAGVLGKPEPTWTTKEKAEAYAIEPVLHMGLGCCLTAMSAINAAKEPLFEAPAEDVFFFNRLREAGFQPMVDHYLSSAIGHVHEIVLTNEDSVRREAERAAAIRR